MDIQNAAGEGNKEVSGVCSEYSSRPKFPYRHPLLRNHDSKNTIEKYTPLECAQSKRRRTNATSFPQIPK
jgi:hypothetical protein